MDSNIRFSELADKWLNEYGKNNFEPSTQEFYKNLLVRINQAIGSIRLSKLQPHHLQEFYNNLKEEGVSLRDERLVISCDLSRLLKTKNISKIALAETSKLSVRTIYAACRKENISLKSGEAIAAALNVEINDLFDKVDTNKKLTDKTILHYHRCISAILQMAVQWQVLLDNPARRMKAPKVERKEAAYLEDTEAVKMAELLGKSDIRFRTAMLLLLYAGLRRGELSGLEWKDIDFKNNVVHIVRASQYVPRKGIIEKDPKNYSSRRVLKLPQEAFDILKEYKAWQNTERLKLGDMWMDKIIIKYGSGEERETKNDRLFTQEKGLPIFPATFNYWLNKFIEKNSLKHFTPHSLRHTNISLLIAAGVPIKTVSSRAGHAQTTTTANIYAHAIKTADEIAAAAIGDILNMDKIRSS